MKTLFQKILSKGLFIVVILLFTESSWAQQNPYQNNTLSAGERATDLLSRLTLTGKPH